MKKILAGLTLAILAIAVLAPVASAETVPAEIQQCTMRHDLTTDASWATKGFVCQPQGTACLFTDTAHTCGACCVMDTIYTVTDWVFMVILAIAIIFIFIGAFNIITAGGSPEKVNTGRSYIIYAAVGFIVALLAKLIPVIAKNILGLG